MSFLRVQIVDPDGALRQSETIEGACPGPELWSHVAGWAQKLQRTAGVRIQVRDEAGGLVLLTGAASVLLAERLARRGRSALYVDDGLPRHDEGGCR